MLSAHNTSTMRHSWRKLRNTSLASLAREKVDSLVLIIACLSTILIHLGSMAYWISFSAITLMIWRAWLTLTGKELPPRWILLPISLLLMGGIFLNFRTFFGRETGVAMLTILLACKMLEMHAKRDLFVIIFLGFFLLLTNFFNSQSLVSAFLASISATLLFLAQLSFQFGQKRPNLWGRLKLVLKMLLLAIPVTIIGFFLFPRIQGPLWGLPSDANIARSGLSDSMSPGNISKLAMSEELVFRAKFIEKTPDKSTLYWRAIVLDDFDGRTWTKHVMRGGVEEKDIQVFGNAIHHQIILEPTGTQHIFALDSVFEAPELLGVKSRLNVNGEIASDVKLNNRVRYQAVSYPSYKLNQHPRVETLQHNLALPADFNPRTRQFALSIRQQHNSLDARVTAVLRHFRQNKYYYTLEPPALGKHSIDEFLFDTKSGFCEHYSSAFVNIMRAMGTPARVVTGYLGGEINKQDEFLEIRQSDAHAWAEVWTNELGWVRVDPTGAVAPERVLKNLSASQIPRGFAGMVGTFFEKNSWLSDLRMRWSALNNTWNQWVLNYNESKKRNLLQSLGLSELDWPKTLLVIFAIGAVLLAFMTIPLLRHRPRLSKLDRLYLALCVRVSKIGHPKLLHEGPIAYSTRLRNVLDDEKNQHLQRFIAIYVAKKYGKNSAIESTTLQQLKSLLKQLH